MSRKTTENNWHLETQLVRSGTMRSNFGETSEAIFMNSGFVYDSAETAESRFNGQSPGFVYSRYTNPNLAMLEQRIATVEGGERCCVMASGMAAVHASLMCFLKPGDRVVAHRVLFGSCHYIITQVMPRFGIEVELIDGTGNAAWDKAVKPGTTAVFIETPANPTLELVDIVHVAQCCKKVGAKLVVDNVFAGTLHQKPLELGADIVVYSTTKHMDGQGRTLGGAVIAETTFIDEILLPYHRHTGPAMSPFTAWLITKSMETLSLRVERQCENAAKIAAFLDNHPKIESIRYPGLPSHPQYTLAQKQMRSGGSLIALYIKGGKEKAFAFVNKLKVIDISNNLGDSRSLITHPASSTHSNIPQDQRDAIGITGGMLRLSVGIENADDLIADIDQALG